MKGIGIIGYGGRIGDITSRMKAIDPRIPFVAVSDPSNEACLRFKEKLNPNGKIYHDYNDLVKDPALDWVIIGSWNCFHRDHAIAALNAGKHVFCEKPLAISTQDCIAIREAAQRSGKIFIIGFVLRFSAHYQKIKEMIGAGTIGKIVSMEFNETLHFCHGGFIHADWRRLRRNAGTHLLEKCCHDIDLVNWLIGSRARRVASFGGLDFFKPENAIHMERLGSDSNGNKAYCTWPCSTGHDPFTSDKDIFDNQVAIIEFENNVRATFHTNCNAGIPERRMYILGTEGAIRADVLTGQLQVQRIGFNDSLEEIKQDALGGHGGADGFMAERLTDAVINNKELSPGIAEAVESAVTCFCMDEAADTGKVVDCSPYWEKAGYMSHGAEVMVH